MKGKKCFGLLLALSIIFGLSLNVSSSVYADTLSINRFGLFGQKTYGASNAWQSNLGYAGTTMHSVYKWEVWSSSLSASQTGKYAGVQFSGLINVPADFYVNISQGFSIEQCVVGNTAATLSNTNTAWALNPATSTTGPQIIWSAESTLEFPTNNISGQMYCTFRSNNGVYFLQHITTSYGTVSFGTTNFNANFSNTLSDELLQFQILQNQQIIEGIGQTTDAINNLRSSEENRDQQDRDNINSAKDDADSSSDSSQQQAEQTGTTLLKAFTDFVGALTNARPSNCNLDMDLGNLDMGVVNLCSLSPPPVFQTIASIFMILFCVPLSIATARKVINLFRSFQ